MRDNIFLHRIYNIANQFGFNPIKTIRALIGILPYLSDLISFKNKFSGTLVLNPCLDDRYKEAGDIRNEYFWQDLIVARMIYENNPIKHVDIGSRIDGFIAHIASYREVEIFDVRPISIKIPGVTFRNFDITNLEAVDSSIRIRDHYCDSISCLHSLEHFGLGRYGDKVDPDGYKKGIRSICNLLKVDGVFYLSTPIGRERVEFNANWVFDPKNIIYLAESAGLELESFGVINSSEGYKKFNISEDVFRSLQSEEYKLGLFIFRKSNNSF